MMTFQEWLQHKYNSDQNDFDDQLVERTNERAYQREYMRRYRSKKRNTGTVKRAPQHGNTQHDALVQASQEDFANANSQVSKNAAKAAKRHVRRLSSMATISGSKRPRRRARKPVDVSDAARQKSLTKMDRSMKVVGGGKVGIKEQLSRDIDKMLSCYLID